MKLILVKNDGEVLDETKVDKDEWNLAQKGRPVHAQSILNRLLSGDINEDD